MGLSIVVPEAIALNFFYTIILIILAGLWMWKMRDEFKNSKEMVRPYTVIYGLLVIFMGMTSFLMCGIVAGLSIAGILVGALGVLEFEIPFYSAMLLILLTLWMRKMRGYLTKEAIEKGEGFTSPYNIVYFIIVIFVLVTAGLFMILPFIV